MDGCSVERDFYMPTYLPVTNTEAIWEGPRCMHSINLQIFEHQISLLYFPKSPQTTSVFDV